jgi:hypothetical protein
VHHTIISAPATRSCHPDLKLVGLPGALW